MDDGLVELVFFLVRWIIGDETIESLPLGEEARTDGGTHQYLSTGCSPRNFSMKMQREVGVWLNSYVESSMNLPLALHLLR